MTYYSSNDDMSIITNNECNTILQLKSHTNYFDFNLQKDIDILDMINIKNLVKYSVIHPQNENKIKIKTSLPKEPQIYKIDEKCIVFIPYTELIYIKN